MTSTSWTTRGLRGRVECQRVSRISMQRFHYLLNCDVRTWISVQENRTHHCMKIFTNTTEQRLLLDDDRRSAGHESRRHLWDTKVHCRIHQAPSSDNWIQYISSHLISLRPIWIIFPHQRLNLPSLNVQNNNIIQTTCKYCTRHPTNKLCPLSCWSNSPV